MQHEAVFHTSEAPYGFALSVKEWKVRLRTGKDGIARVNVIYGDRYNSPGSEAVLPMERVAGTRYFDYYEAVLPAPAKRVRYQFLLEGTSGQTLWYGETGPMEERDDRAFFQCPYISESMVHRLPGWLSDAVAYQVFPDRFWNGDKSNDPEGTLDWDSGRRPEPDSCWGGDLEGILNRLPYLEELGVNLLYLTPVFRSPSNHKYDTEDYYSIDPAFGDEELMKRLVEEAHARGIRVMLDAVFNHTGDRFFAFRDVLNQGAASAYKDWYHADECPVVQEPAPNYETFGTGIPSMPKLNVDHPDVQRYLLDVTEYWMNRLNLDGWRLDVANEVPPAFWRRFRSAVRAQNPDALIIGEIMHQAGPWLRGDQFDGVMNYPLRDALLEFFARQSISPTVFLSRIEELRMAMPEAGFAGSWNLLGSHDTERFLTSCTKGGRGWTAGEYAEERMKLAVLFQLTYPGTPLIYYGDEAGMTGGTDPDCRKPMVWRAEQRNAGMEAHYKQLLSLRRRFRPLGALGAFQPWLADDARHLLGYVREWGEERILVLIHNYAGSGTYRVELPLHLQHRTVRDLLTGGSWLAGEVLELPFQPFGAYLLTV